jgi:TRAP-type C4-dicarboxylate transport system substrate-binding protein
VADPLIFAVNQEVWESFTPEDQEILRQAAIEAGALGIEVAREGLTEDDQSLVEEIRGYGVEVVTLTDEERQAFVDVTRPVYEEWTATVGEDLVRMAEESIANR